MNDEIITFGKHKGKPIGILAADKEYTRWLLAQPWFKTKYQNIYTIVINNFHEPVNTPEHNAMQIKFLDRSYSLKFAHFLEPDLFHWNSQQINKKLLDILAKSRKRDAEKQSNICEEKFHARVVEMNKQKLLTISTPNFEGGHDVSYFVRYGVDTMSRSLKIQVEIKPSIGDDFPAVLRQMKNAIPAKIHGDFDESFHCLLVRDYVGEGANKEQFVLFFETQRFKVVFASDLDNACLPLFDEEFKLDLS
jgi:hypothetical protein